MIRPTFLEAYQTLRPQNESKLKSETEGTKNMFLSFRDCTENASGELFSSLSGLILTLYYQMLSV